MILITTYYRDQDREHELLFALKQNINNPLIEKIKIIGEEEPSLKSAKIEIAGDFRPTFADCFAEVKEGQINIIANSDIFFNNTIAHAGKLAYNQCYAITRHEYNEGNMRLFDANPAWSQDVWIVRRKPKNLAIYEDVIAENLTTHNREVIKFYMGVPGCDNHLAYLLSSDYHVINPYYDIQAIHVHKETQRNYKLKYRITGNSLHNQFGKLRKINPTRI